MASSLRSWSSYPLPHRLEVCKSNYIKIIVYFHCSAGFKWPPPIIEDNWNYGGGYGYPHMIDPEADGVVAVRTLADLRAAVETPKATVYVEDGAEIDLTGAELCLAEGVTLAGGRGREVGGHSPGTRRLSSPLV